MIGAVCFAALAVISVAVAQSSPDPRQLWVAHSGGLAQADAADGAMLRQMSTHRWARSVAVDLRRSMVWSQVGYWRIKAFGFDGLEQASVWLPRPLIGNTWMVVDEAAGNVWAANFRHLYRISTDGERLSNRRAPWHDLYTGLALDAERSRLWVADSDTVVARDAQGDEILRVEVSDIGRRGIGTIAFDPELDAVWVAGHDKLLRFDAEGERVFSAVAPAAFAFLAPDGRGGAWAASHRRLYHIDKTGKVSQIIDPFTGGWLSRFEFPVSLTVDGHDGSVWIASGTRMIHFGLDGRRLKTVWSWDIDGRWRFITDLKIPFRRPALRIEIVAPEEDALINDNAPAIEIRVDGATPEANQLTLASNGRDVTARCETRGGSQYRCTPVATLVEGEHTLVVTMARDNRAAVESEPRHFRIDSIAPVISLVSPPAGLVTNQVALEVAGSVSESAEVTINGAVMAKADLHFTHDVTLLEGNNSFRVEATDPAGNNSSVTRIVTLDTAAPSAPVAADIQAGPGPDGDARLEGEAGSVEPGSTVAVTNNRTGETVTVQANDQGGFVVNIAGQPGDTYTIVATDAAGNRSDATEMVSRDAGVPPDPEDIAPERSQTGITPLSDAVAFLYSGPDAIQQGVAPEVIEDRRVSVLRGEVRSRTGTPLPGVKISILNHPELGFTRTQADGGFDMAVNGGGVLTVVYKKASYLPVQRTLRTGWNGWHHADDVVMLPLNDKVTTIDLTDTSQPFQVARGSVVEDAAGARQATLLFPAGLTAEITRPDGSTMQLSQLDVRATEYTVGASGPEAMPGKLPPASAYTYAVELSVDQMLEQGIKVNGKGVRFSQPVPFYVDNFLEFPTGEAVPVGYYDGDKAAWIPYDNGRIVEVLSEQNGKAILDVTGSGEPTTPDELAALGITAAERVQLAQLYEPGDSLWRVALTHLSTWDCNWPYGPPRDAEGPDVTLPDTDGGPDNSGEENECTGCSISPQRQSVGEEIPIPGTPFSLHYQSARAPGFLRNSVRIPLTGGGEPASLGSVLLEIDIAGRHFTKSFLPTRHNYIYTWDGKDAYGRTLVSREVARIRLTYFYPCVYYSGENGFGRFGDALSVLGTRERCQGFAFSRSSEVVLVPPSIQPVESIGNWSLSIEHHRSKYGLLFRGDGGRRRLLRRITTVAGGADYRDPLGDGGPATEAYLPNPGGVAVGPDGSLYIADTSNYLVRSVDLNGIITTIAGTGHASYWGDGGLATEADLSFPRGLAIAADGSIYIADPGNHTIRRVSPNGIITTVAGTGYAGFSGDGGPANEARIDRAGDITVAPDGSLYIADRDNHRVRRVSPNGIITTIAGTGESGFSGDGGPATSAQLDSPQDVEVDHNGNLYIATEDRIRRVASDGTITTLPLPECRRTDGHRKGIEPSAIALSADGSLYILDGCGLNVIHRLAPDGSVRVVVGGRDNISDGNGDGGPPLAARLVRPRDIAIGPKGGLYIAADDVIRRVTHLPIPNLPGGGYRVAAKSGAQAFFFDAQGRHMATKSVYTNAIFYEFTRDDAGRLIAVTDGDGNTTTIERHANGQPSAIVAPDGQRIMLTVNSQGQIVSVTDPTGAQWSMAYTTDGLLTRFTDRAKATTTFAYNEAGRLIRDNGPNGSGWTLARTELDEGYRVRMASGAGRVSLFTFKRPLPNKRVYRNTASDGSVTVRTYSAGNTIINRPDGTTITRQEGPDPRFGMSAPVIERATVTTPSGLERATERERAATLFEEGKPLEAEQLTRTVTVNGRTTQSVYDGVSQTWTTTTAEGRRALVATDDLSRPIRIQLASFAPVERSYDTRGRLTSISRSANGTMRSMQFAYYDSGVQAGYLKSVTDAAGRTTIYEHDANGRIVSQMRPDGRSVKVAYDAEGRLIRVQPPGQPAHVMVYNDNGSRTAYDPPDIGAETDVTRYSFNADRQLTQIKRPSGKILGLLYDFGGRLAQRTTPAGMSTYSYHAQTGQLAAINAPGNVGLAFTWDGFLPTQTRWSGPVSGTLTRGFDNNFWLTQTTVNGQSVTFDYDNDGLMTAAGEMAMVRDAASGLLSTTTLGSIGTTQGYNAFGELQSYSATAAGATVYDAEIRRDQLGRIVEKTTTVAGEAHTWQYVYDDVGRLTQVLKDGTTQASYVYDTNGNRQYLSTSGATVTATYDEQDRLLTYGSNSYGYTAGGYLKEKITVNGITTYNYDLLGHLRGATLPDGAVIDYLIDGRGRRVGKKVNGTLVKGWLYRDALNPVAELDGNGYVTARFVYANRANVPGYMIKNGVTYRIISDERGSPRLVINASTGEVVQRMDYNAFGYVIRDTNPGFQPFGFAGGLYDQDTGLVRFGARDYDPLTGRWTAKDPILFKGGQANLYGYVLNDPINFIDPNGRFGVVATLGIGATVGGLSALVGTWYATGSFLVLLCHKFLAAPLHPQQGHRISVRAMARASRKRQVAIESGTWRCIGPSPAWAEAFG